jgi:mono/diheme cytochrome c family protein
LRSIARLLSAVVLLVTVQLLASCSLAAPAPIAQSNNVPSQPLPAQQAAQPFQLPSRRPSAAAGEALYQQKCVRCHGEAGRGNGEMAGQLQAQFGSPVADLTSDVVARAKTPEQWYAIVTSGRLDNGMPGFAGSLDVDQRWDVIAYAWTFAAPPQQIELGKAVYAEQCAHCHGDTGTGDGKDAQGQLPNLSDFNAIAKVEPGRWDQALDSAHVPSFAGTLSADAKRAAIDYIRTFAYDSLMTAQTPDEVPSTAGSQLPLATPAGPIAPSTIDGYIATGTPGQTLPASVTEVIFEYQRSRDSMIISQTVPLDAQGRFVITGTQLEHGDVMRARVLYDEIGYFSEVVPFGAAATLPITIYERSTTASQVRAEVLHIIAVPAENGLQVSEVYVLSNAEPRTVANPGHPILRIGLPAAATQVMADSGMPSDVLVASGDNLDFYGSLPPGGQGSTSIAFSYFLPDGATALDRPVYFPIELANILVQGNSQTVRVVSDRLTSQGVENFEGKPYQLFQAMSIMPGQNLPLSVEQAGTPVDWRIALGVVLVVVGGVGLVLWQRGQKKQPAAAARSPEAQRETLIDQIAALDDEFAAGQIDEVNYKAKRGRLKDKLLKLMDEE